MMVVGRWFRLTLVDIHISIGRIIELDVLMRVRAKSLVSPGPWPRAVLRVFEGILVVLAQTPLEDNAVVFAVEFGATFPLATKSFDDELTGS